MNGYSQITLGGELRAIKFNLHAIQLIASRGQGSDVKPEEIKQNTTYISFFAWYVYAGLCGNEFVKSNGANELCKESFEEVYEWVEDLVLDSNTEELSKVWEAFLSSKHIQKQLEGKEDKKKVKKKADLTK